jgi:RND family efflux transporter MFP subunit
LEIAKRPQRTQEVEVAENGVAQAQANYDKAKTDLTRYETLVKEGAVAQSVLDQYVNQERVSKAALDSAKKQLEIAKVGGRDENVRNAESALARAQWALRVAKANKVQVNVRQDAVKAAKAGVAQAEAEIRAARATVAQSQAAVSNAQLQLADTEIRSPIDGVIASRLTEPGQMAGPASPVVQLVALDTVFFEAQVPETDLATIGAGLSVDVKTDAFPNKTFAGKIARIYPTGNTASRTVVLRVEIANANKMLRPGLFARGVIIAERREGVVVPKDAIVRADGKLYIFVAEGGSRAVRREVRTGIEDVTTIEIVSGVNTGETVIVSGQGALEDGATIKVEDEKRQTAAL